MSKVIDCRNDLIARLQLIAELGTAKVQAFTSPDQLSEYFKSVAPPAVGVVYEGMRAGSEQSQAPRGLATSATFGLYLIVNTPSMVNLKSQQDTALELLDSMRKKILLQSAPAGHPWKFMVETFVDSSKGIAMWSQRWQTSIVNER